MSNEVIDAPKGYTNWLKDVQNFADMLGINIDKACEFFYDQRYMTEVKNIFDWRDCSEYAYFHKCELKRKFKSNFEEWANSKNMDLGVTAEGEYCDATTSNSFDAWCAAQI